ncbi:unnamed protein product [Prorocentrum cordatum]|uniref:Major facilitator superfamily (MFS) profile domain-containing protein n=1 Tax=Prorocentrum cordatum TaxID=2364126 RepID=A0ABN9UUJ4_9DINO|nr:unnamed protein product [Polarella glacialis]
MLGEGIAISSLPYHMTRLGSSPMMVGLATSAFSVAQMVCCPLLVPMSGRVGRTRVLRVCLAGATASSLLIAFSRSSTWGIILGRMLAGVFASSVPLAQAAVTDIVPSSQAALALSRVSAAAQLGVVVGPAASAILQETFRWFGVPSSLLLTFTFGASAAFALAILALQGKILARLAVADERRRSEPDAAPGRRPVVRYDADGRARFLAGTAPPQPGVQGLLAQPLLRLVAMFVSWSLTLSVSTYGLFAPRMLGYRQPQLSATFTAGAAFAVLVQVLFPRLVKRVGAHAACTLGLLGISAGLSGTSLVQWQPAHSALYLVNRGGSGIADTATATLVTQTSNSREERSRNLALIQSTRAFARIFTPIASGMLFDYSCRFARAPGALPYLCAAGCLLLLAPVPLWLRRAARKD